MLIVNADDFGLTVETSRAIASAHRNGIVTSTSVLAVSPAATRSLVELDEPGLDVGVHLAIVGEDPPLLSRNEVPTLVDRRGRFARSWKELLRRAHRLDSDELRREFEAQIELVAAASQPLTHLDTHQHVHLLPGVGAAVVDAAQANDIPWIRVPRGLGNGPLGLGTRALSGPLRRRADAAGLLTPDAFAGIEGAGHIDEPSLRRLLTRLARHGGDVTELNVHPGANHDPDRHRYDWGYRWGTELAALTDPDMPTFVAGLGLELGSRRKGAARWPLTPRSRSTRSPDPRSSLSGRPRLARLHWHARGSRQ